MSRTPVLVLALVLLLVPRRAIAEHDDLPRIRGVGAAAELLLARGLNRSVSFRRVANQVTHGNTTSTSSGIAHVRTRCGG
jgi:hypothetical protein